MRPVQVVAAATIALTACATIPEAGGGGESLPSAVAGPFRALLQEELGNNRVAPNAVDDDVFSRDPSVIDVDGDPSTLAVAGYFGAAVAQGSVKPAADDPTRVILRFGALDGRSFDESAEVALAPTEAWEGGVIGHPSRAWRARSSAPARAAGITTRSPRAPASSSSPTARCGCSTRSRRALIPR